MSMTHGGTLRITLGCILCVILYGCSFIERNTIGLVKGEGKKEAALIGEVPAAPAQKTEPSAVKIEEFQKPQKISIDDIEILWKIPAEPVDGFVIHYGTARDKLDKELRLSSDEIERFDHPQYGPTYRYYLRGFPREEKVFVAVSAFSDTIVSEPSEVFEVVAPSKASDTQDAQR